MEEIPVKVAVRIRPLLPREILHRHQVCVRIVPNTQQIIIGKDHVFTFDFVFGQKSAQDDIYLACIEPLVVSFLEGYNVTVFAYGQTGSGKTYTIGGGHIASISEEEKGIIPRAIQELFLHISENHNVDFTVKISYIEVYKDELRDLLELETSSKDLHIREDEKGNTVIVGSKECQVETADEVMSLLEAGNAARHTGATQMNEHSSRSHAVFTISVIQQRPKQTGEAEVGIKVSNRAVQQICSKFHFVDLAGSERVTKTGNTGERFKESIQINSGLLALGNVISALGDQKKKNGHIPYRDAKITRILKDSLGGNAKTVMITCVSPSSSDFDESLNSLKYANRARNIRNKPIVNYNPDWDRIDEMELEIKTLREALLSRQAAIVANASQASQDLLSQEKERILSLEEQLGQVQLECFHYRNCTHEAFRFLTDMRNTVSLTKSQQHRLQDWLDMAEEMKGEIMETPGADSGVGNTEEEHSHRTILQLKRELRKCQDALASDEEVFIEKEAELKELRNQIQTVVRENQEYLRDLQKAQDNNRIQNEKLVEQQLLNDRMKGELELLKRNKLLIPEVGSEDEQKVVAAEKRPYSVPLDNKHQALSFSVANSTDLRPNSRKVHTSPPAYSLERVVAGFRTRSQMLLGHIEEQDEVLCREFSDQSDEDEREKHQNRDKTAFKRNINRTWTKNQCPDLLEPEVKNGVFSLNEMPVDNSESEFTTEVENLRQSQTLNLEKLKDTDRMLAQAKQKLRDLTINICMKEGLIKELVKTGKDAQEINKQYSWKISQLEQEADKARNELTETQKQLQELENKEMRDAAEKIRLQKEFRKKMDAAKLKVQSLQKKQQDTKKFASMSTETQKRLTELERSVGHMKQQQTQLQKKLQEETEKKRKLETEIQRDQQRIKELQLKTEQQKKMLRIKTEEIAAFKKTKRSMSTPDELQRIEEQRKWLDEEVEKVLQQRQTLAELEEDLKKREEAITKKETLLQEKSHFEIKKLRSSQALSRDILKLSHQLSVLDEELTNKSAQMQEGTEDEKRKIADEAHALQKEREHLLQRRDHLDDKLRHGSVLSPEEERILFQLEEGIEALDIAIEYKNEAIQHLQQSVRMSTQTLKQNEASFMEKIGSLSPSEIRSLLFRYFSKVVGLREKEHKVQLECEEMKMKINEQSNVMRELESALERLTLEADRRLTLQQKEHEKDVQLMLQQFRVQGGEGIAENIKFYESKIQQLEKDLFFYKKTSRELKKKMRELVVDSLNQHAVLAADNGANKELLNQEEIEISSEESKWNSKSEDDKSNEKMKCAENVSTNSTSQQISRQRKERTEASQSPISLARNRKQSLNAEDQSTPEDPEFSNMLTGVPASFPSGDSISQWHGASPMRVSRKDLRQISASELSMRRSSLGASINSAPADSIELLRKSADFGHKR
ncbi:kinesin-like protein KIF27 [Protopterus annectens]|uniref:kinesin-like protein KIF27 n=1 Tax=Protopterus annectens TaxID=7888 RepID=UPI001CF9C4C9|nr:kinesin-like protein KIF27 [Protopterus annectens]